MRQLALIGLVFAGQLAAAPSLPEWATPGTETRSVRDALDALHGASFPVDVMGDLAVVAASHGPLSGMWMFTGGIAGGPPTRYYRFEIPAGGSEGTIVSIVCEDTADECEEHASILARLSPAPPLPPPEPPSPDGQVRGWIPGEGGMMPQREVDRDISCVVCAPPRYPADVVLSAPPRPVVLRITVDAMGNILGTVIQQSSGNRILDRAALTHSKSWSFRPGQRGLIPVGGDILVPVDFSTP